MLLLNLAERVRFELTRALRPYLRSRQADSTTLPPLRKCWRLILNKALLGCLAATCHLNEKRALSEPFLTNPVLIQLMVVERRVVLLPAFARQRNQQQGHRSTSQFYPLLQVMAELWPVRLAEERPCSLEGLFGS